MDWATLRASVDFALHSTARAVELMFIGGEPLLEWPKLVRAVRYAEKLSPPGKKVAFAITTNGLLITEEVAAFLSEHGFRIQLSFDGIPEAQDNRHRETFAATERLLGMLRAKYTEMFEDQLQICITLVPSAIPSIAKSVRYLINNGVREIAVTPCLTRYSARMRDYRKPLDDQFSKIRDISLAHFEQTGEVPFLLFRKTGRQKPSGRGARTMCSVMSGEGLVIDVDGKSHGCPLLADCYQEFPSDFLRRRIEPLGMGDFRDRGFEKRRPSFRAAVRKAEIFHHKEKKYSSYRKCGSCEYIESCSVCPVSIGYDPKNIDPRRVPDFHCAFNMAVLKYRDSFPNMPDPIERLESLLALAEKTNRQSFPSILQKKNYSRNR
jgi:sulfatase maturation enzyme AslB (radical SAM superfamily)